MDNPTGTSKTWAIISSHYINATSIVDSLKAIGWKGPIVCIKEEGAKKELTDLIHKGVETWVIPMVAPVDLLIGLAERIPSHDKKVVFFCDERFHEAFLNHANLLLPNARFFLGSSTHLSSILNRFTFYRFIEEQNLALVPKTLAGYKDPWVAFNNGFFIRPNLTWDGLNRLPRVQIVRTKEMQRCVEKKLTDIGLTSQDWCYQEVLSIDPRDNVSVCGWHGPNKRLYFATHHIMRHPTEVGNGDVTELIPVPNGLDEATKRVLEALEYEGPFELEFVLDKMSGEYKVIELNPRFWMQHGLIERVSGHELVKKYTGVDADSVSLSDQDVRYWINSFYAAFRIFKGDLRVIRYLLGSHALVAPGWSLALNYSFSILNQKLIKLVIR